MIYQTPLDRDQNQEAVNELKATKLIWWDRMITSQDAMLLTTLRPLTATFWELCLKDKTCFDQTHTNIYQYLM